MLLSNDVVFTANLVGWTTTNLKSVSVNKKNDPVSLRISHAKPYLRIGSKYSRNLNKSSPLELLIECFNLAYRFVCQEDRITTGEGFAR